MNENRLSSCGIMDLTGTMNGIEEWKQNEASWLKSSDLGRELIVIWHPSMRARRANSIWSSSQVYLARKLRHRTQSVLTDLGYISPALNMISISHLAAIATKEVGRPRYTQRHRRLYCVIIVDPKLYRLSLLHMIFRGRLL
jgi:hypothetical protein